MQGDVAAVALRPDFYQLLAQAGQRPSLRRLRHRQRPREVAELVGRHMELEPDGIGGEGPAGQPCPFVAPLPSLQEGPSGQVAIIVAIGFPFGSWIRGSSPASTQAASPAF
jgi:hypothetical protein